MLEDHSGLSICLLYFLWIIIVETFCTLLTNKIENNTNKTDMDVAILKLFLKKRPQC